MSSNPFELADEVAPLDPRKGIERFDKQVEKFAEWYAALPNEPLDVIITARPFDTVPRSWAYRTYTDEQRDSMLPCLRLFVHIENLWGDKVLESDVVIAQPPVDQDPTEEPDWITGLGWLALSMPTTMAALQSAALGAIYSAHGIDAEKFLAETEGVLDETTRMDMLEAQMYLCDLEDQLAANPDAPTATLMRGVMDAIRVALAEKWAGFAPKDGK